MNYIVYHKIDLDGWCSAAIAIKFLREKNLPYTLVPFTYGDTTSFLPAKGDVVFLLDVSFPGREAQIMQEVTGAKIIWCDHHKSAIEGAESYGATPGTPRIEGLRDSGFAACELTWMYLYPTLKMPWLVRLLGVYDSWRSKAAEFPVAESLQHFARTSWMRNPEAVEWDHFLSADPVVTKEVDDMCIAGTKIQDAAEVRWAESISQAGFVREIDGLKVLCLNSAERGSQLFASEYNVSEHDAMMVFRYNGKAWDASVYSTKESVDCSVFCKRRGGGGHKGAAGFRSKSFTGLFADSPLVTMP